MSWWIWVVGILVILIIIYSIASDDEKNNKSRSKHSSKNGSKSPQEIADEVTTVAQFKALEKKLDTADEKRANFSAYDSKSLKQEVSLDERYELLQEAFDIASIKVLRWQFIPNYDIDTPLNILNNAYKIFSSNEYQNKLDELGNNENEWYGLRGDDEPDEKEPEISFLIKFRKIVEDEDLSQEDQIKKINALSSRDKENAELYFDFSSPLKPGDQWFAGILSDDGLPLAYELYQEGFTTPEKCLEIDPETFISRKGVGSKKVEQLKQYQERIKSKNIKT